MVITAPGIKSLTRKFCIRAVSTFLPSLVATADRSQSPLIGGTAGGLMSTAPGTRTRVSPREEEDKAFLRQKVERPATNYQ